MVSPGFHGKTPALGDFVTRRIPAGFLQSWDAWLQSLVRASRDRLGADWLPAWLEAPVWHFGLGAELAGPEPWFGVLIPSVDRVGRYFPFTILGASGEGGMALEDWALLAERLALGALEDGFDPGWLDGELVLLGNPSRPALISALSPREREQAWPTAGESVWRCRGTARVAAATRRCAGLPDGAQAAGLVGG